MITCVCLHFAVKSLKVLHWGLVVYHTNKSNFLKTYFFLLLKCVGQNSLSCGTLICLLSVGNSFKSCIIYVDFFSMFNRNIPILNRVARSIDDILRYEKVSFDTSTLGTCLTKIKVFEKYLFSWVTQPCRPQCSPFKDVVTSGSRGGAPGARPP